MKKFAIIFFSIALIFLYNSCSKDENLSNLDSFESDKLEGQFIIVVEDQIDENKMFLENHKAYLKEKDGNYLEMVIPENYIQRMLPYSGYEIIIEGNIKEGKIIPKSVDNLSELLSNAKRPGNGNGQAGGGGGGSADLLVVMVSDTASSPNCTAEEIEYQLIGSDNEESSANLFSASSKGKFTIGSVSTAEVSISHIVCSVTSLSSRVDPILAEQGISVSNYDHIIYVTAPICSYGGQARLNGKIVHNAYCTWAVVNPHEIGHNKGMHHSTAYNSDGTVSPYGDPSCFMATSFSELNAPHRIEMGWLKGKSTSNVRNSGSYDLAPLELESTNEKQVLLVDVGLVNFGKPETYYLSYRAPIGNFDDNISTNVRNKLSIHTWSGEKSFVTRYVDALDTGESYTDLENGLVITNLGISNEVMRINIEIL